MRPLALVFFWLLQAQCHAQQGSLAACMDRLAADPRFALLAKKTAAGTTANTPPAMLADRSLAGNMERPAISEWAAARGACIKADSEYGNATYRPPLQTYGIEAETRVIAAAAALYNREITFGEFNRRRQAISEQLRARNADLSRQIQSQRAALEQSDRQAQEREQMQREIDDAELQLAAARQQAEQAREDAARFPNGAYRRNGPRTHRLAPIAPFRNCFRFGSRIICTG